MEDEVGHEDEDELGEEEEEGHTAAAEADMNPVSSPMMEGEGAQPYHLDIEG